MTHFHFGMSCQMHCRSPLHTTSWFLASCCSQLCFYAIMTFQKISQDLKSIALLLWECGFDVLNVMDAHSVSQASIYQWQWIFDEMGAITRPTICRRDCTISVESHGAQRVCRQTGGQCIQLGRTYLPCGRK
ncbi:hypothetical protein FA15DRAFT_232874 [Coprinopsis marcescibilis]|uniref:Uncharacterized protein n=1 Tax=Coprinopsis marcescibilis TaxID=230819 RepID=A0A5C3KT01_COPMA|nr:hypothetical protein FA15DRAFT_232874 [Coprinopsis marcescibilis]